MASAHKRVAMWFWCVVSLLVMPAMTLFPELQSIQLPAGKKQARYRGKPRQKNRAKILPCK